MINTRVPRYLLMALLAWNLAGEPARGTDGDRDHELADVTVTAAASRSRLTSGSANSIADDLLAVPGVLVHSQGTAGIQSDISIRGSSFSGAGLSVGGMALKNPQTEHFQADLPLSPALFEAPAVLTGLDQVRGSSAHLAGTINLDFAPMRGAHDIEAGWGEQGWNWQDLFLQQSLGNLAGMTVGMGVFGTREMMQGVDHADNDMDRTSGGLHLQLDDDEFQADLAAGSQRKTFGARSYYGVNPDWPAEERLEDSIVVAGARRRTAAAGNIRGMAVYRTTKDRYRLVLPDGSLYENRHESTIQTAGLDGEQPLADSGRLHWRVGAEAEALDSAALGDHERERADLLVLPAVSIDAVTLTAGVKVHVFSEWAPVVQPQAGCQWAVSEQQWVFLAYTEGVREPSFTELNYESPGSLGNEGLERQLVRGEEVGWRYDAGESHGCRATVFRRSSRHTVDWIKGEPSASRWLATDLGDVDTVGVELVGHARLPGKIGTRLAYTWLEKDHDADFYASRYVLDYPRHHARVNLALRVADGWTLDYQQELRWQEPSEARDEAFGADGRLALHVEPRDRLRVTVRCDNLWDDAYETYVGQIPAPRRVSGSLALAW